VATVSNGVVSGWKAGTATITVTDQSGTIQAECRVTVRVDAIPVTAVTVSSRTLSVNTGGTGNLTASVSPSNATMKGVTWVSSNENVARVEPNGRVVAVTAGTAVISAISDSGGRAAACTVTISVPVTSVTLPDSIIRIRVGQTYQLRPVITPADATNRTAIYSVASTPVATVSTSGLITGRRAGTTTVTVSVAGRTATATIVVSG